MKLIKEEKQILTLLDCAGVDGIEEWVQKFINLPKAKIGKIVKKFKELGLIEVKYLPNDKNLHYFHDKVRIKPDMLDDDLRFKRDYGSESKLLDFSDNFNVKSKKQKSYKQ